MGNWIGVTLRGAGANNGSGIGARITCEYTNALGEAMSRHAVVDGGSLRGSQQSQVIRFGLGEFGSDPLLQVDITVDWPNGWQQVVSFGRSDLNAVNQIWDNTAPGLRSNSESFSYQPQLNGSVKWTFTWRSNYGAKRERTKITVRSKAGEPGQCTLSETVLQSTTPNVAVQMETVLTRNQFDGYKHTLTWITDCEPDCSYEFKSYLAVDPESGSEVGEESSTWKAADVNVCVQG